MSKQLAKIPSSKFEREPRRDNHDQLASRVQDLFESSGHYGGWSMSEMTAAGFGPVYPDPEPTPDRPEHLQDLSAAMDLALLAFDEADQVWQAVHVAAIEPKGYFGGFIVPRTIEVRYGPDGDPARPSWVTREEAGEELRLAKVAFTTAERAWLLSLKSVEAEAASS